MQQVQVDLANDRFDITFDPLLLTTSTITDTIRELGFEPELVTGAATPPPTAARQLDTSLLPDDVRNLLAKAGAEHKMVLLQFTGPG